VGVVGAGDELGVGLRGAARGYGLGCGNGFGAALLAEGIGFFRHARNFFKRNPIATAILPAQIPSLEFALGQHMAGLIVGKGPHVVPIPVNQDIHQDTLRSTGYKDSSKPAFIQRKWQINMD
jgi:hypothetical protein